MRNPLFISACLFALLFALAGCETDKRKPTPEDTLLGGSGAMGSGDILEGTDVYMGDPDGGLMPRDPAMTGAGGAQPSANFPEGVIGSVYFGFDQYSIAPAERPKVIAAADYLSSNPGASLVAEGHTDWYGTDEYNLGLSDRRANAVRDYLTTLGIAPNRIEVRAMGEQESDQGLAKTDPSAVDDRRVDLIILE